MNDLSATVGSLARLDGQCVEVAGRCWLTATLLIEGVEVALPVRDRGVDLVAYLERDTGGRGLLGRALQLKACRQSAFSLERKYAGPADLFLCYVWHVFDWSRTAAYALAYQEALDVLTAAGYAGSDSWKLKGRHASTKPSAALCTLLEPYRLAEGGWRERLFGVHS